MDYRRYFRLRGRTAGERRAEVSEEIESHIAMRAEDLMRRGANGERARAEAEARFGSRAAVFESGAERDELLRRREGLDGLRRDVRLAARRARRAPGTTLLTVLTYGLGIGLATGVFSLVYGVLLKPLPYVDPGRIVLVQGMDSTGTAIDRVSYANWVDLAEANSTLESTALRWDARLTVNSAARAYHTPAQLVTSEFFTVLGARMTRGRGFTRADADAQAPVVVISETVWRRELGGRFDAESTLRIENESHVVIGVLADAQAYPAGTHLWLLRAPQRRVGGFFRNYIGEEAIARLRPGVTRAEAEADLSAVARRVQAAEPESDYMHGAPLLPLRDHIIGDSARYLKLLTGAVAIVLLLACANIAAVNLARALQSTGEVAVRYALGASRRVVVRQLLIEQILLAVAGAIAGVAIAWAGTRGVAMLASGQLPRVHDIGIDGAVLVFAGVAALLAAVLAGLTPAWKAASASAHSLIGGRGIIAGGRGVAGAPLVAGQLAIAVLLLISAALVVRSFQALLARDTGFSAAGVAAADLALPRNAYTDAGQRARLWQAMIERVMTDPSIAAAAVANWIPTGRGGTGYLLVEGHDEDPTGTGYYVVSEHYFSALGIPIVLGRAFSASDRDGGERVAVINRVMAERYWPDTSPIGRRFRVPGMEGPRESAPPITIIGVVPAVRHDGFEDDRARNQVYVLNRQVPNWDMAMTLVARHTGGNAAAAVAILRREVTALEPSLAVEPQRLEHRLGTLVAERRLLMSILSGFGLISLILAAIGVYGLLSFAVAQRVQEIGIRAALGADRRGIFRLVLVSAARIVFAGVAAGVLLAAWLTRLLESILVDVPRTDPVAWLAAVLALATIALAAALVPAQRAAAVDPLTAIRAVP